MRYSRFILLAVMALLVLLVHPAFLRADTPVPASPNDQGLIADTEVPPVEDGAPYPYPIISYEAPAAAPASSDAPAIDVWYGTTQNFGQLGNPQQWVNIPGTATGTTSLKYSLNGGPDQTLSLGPTGERLYGAGDFNIELAITELVEGANTVLIKANDGVTQVTKTVTVNYDAGNTWPMPYTANWSALGSVQAGAQVVDGRWAILGGRLENVVPGYDRLMAIGDMSWTDYEVTVPVTVNSLNTAEWGPPSNGAGVGIIVRWQGHEGTSQPRDYWRHFGALAWYRWAPNGDTAFELRGNGGGASNIVDKRTDRTIELSTPYIFKMSVQTSPLAGAPSNYRFKFWRASDPEPPEWYLSAPGNIGEPSTGSILLVAHQAMVSFGNVTVKPITAQTFTLNVVPPANGQIIVTPSKTTYTYGERVEIRAQGATGYALSNWTGDFSGNENPIVFDITSDVAVGANFQPSAEEIKLNISSSGGGSVTVAPDKRKYNYGEQVALTPRPNTGFIFAGWTGDLVSSDNPALVVMNRTKTIVANFIAANANSPVSDDFNSCALNTSLWTFINPTGQGSQTVNGTQLLLNVPANVSHNIWTGGNLSVRVMQPTQNTDFEIIAKFESVVSQRYQMQGLLVEQDANNFLRFEVYHDGNSIQLFAARFLDGNPKALIYNRPLSSTPPYLRVTRVGASWSYSYSDNGTDWVSGGSFAYTLNVTKTGVYGANHGTPPFRPAPAHTAIVDYFFNSAAPIVPEDGHTPGNFTITVNKVGQGNVTLNPAKQTYACNEKVTLTAVPAVQWRFVGWSGDLTGSALSQQLTVTRNHTVTATFARGSYQTFLPMTVDK
ncbi:MAG: hypothetical protein K1X50_00350 [Candidatus Promineofilum sp.]|nr:hypothetical protein [Promineifilum sp.]MCW5862351.1 hypothetical protein [Anaerolineae bacterium]